MEEITYYQHFTDTCPVKTTMENIVRLIRDDETVAAKTAAHRADPEAGHKRTCPLFAVAGIMEGGKAESNIVAMTGLAMVDVDHVSSQEGGGSQPLETLFGRLCGDPHTLLCYRTISGDGIRVVFRYELDDGYDLEQQKQYHPKAFLYGNEYYRRTYGVAYDEKCKNVGRLSGLSHDPDVYYEPGAQPFTKEEIRAAAERLVRRRKEQRKRERELRRIADCYEKEIRPKVEADGAVYAAGSHNDYVMRVGYLLNQYGFDKEVAKEWANAVFREYDNVLGVIDSCYQKVEEHGIFRVNNRKSHSLRTPHFSDSQPWVSVEDIKAFLTEHIQLRHNVIRGRVEYKQLQTPSDSPCSGGEEHDYIRDLANTITLKCPPPKQGESEGVSSVSGLFPTYLKKWLVGMIAAWLDPSVVNNVILVLIGEQGTYKTTWFTYLLPPPLRRYFYIKTNANRMGRDDLITLAQYGLVCCEELDTMRPSELNQLKAAVTMTSIDERAAYAHFHEHRPHIASFCGTGNNKQFLSDSTGNRRWLPFEVESILSPREHPFNYDGIYRQAYRLYKSGFRYWFSKEEIVILSEHNRQFESPRLEWELVDTYFRVPAAGEQGEFMPVSRAVQIMGGSIAAKLSAVLVGKAFSDQGYQQIIQKHNRGYIVVQRTAEEIKNRLRLAAVTDVTEEQSVF